MVDFLYDKQTGNSIHLHEPGEGCTFYIRYMPDVHVHSLVVRKIAGAKELWQTVIYNLTDEQHEYLLGKGIEVWA